MRRLVLLCSLAVMVACSKKENAPVADTGMVAPAPAPVPAPAALSLADVAGTWSVVGKYEGTDTTVVTYDLTATANNTGWSIKFPNRAKAVTQRVVSVSGDSVVLEAGPYESAIRKGVQVTTRTVDRLQDGKLVGRTIAHYSVKCPDTVRIITSEGTRK